MWRWGGIFGTRWFPFANACERWFATLTERQLRRTGKSKPGSKTRHAPRAISSGVPWSAQIRNPTRKSPSGPMIVTAPLGSEARDHPAGRSVDGTTTLAIGRFK